MPGVRFCKGLPASIGGPPLDGCILFNLKHASEVGLSDFLPIAHTHTHTHAHTHGRMYMPHTCRFKYT